MQYLQFTSWLEEGYVISRNKPRPNKYSEIALLFSMPLLNMASVLLAFASASTDSAFTFLLDMFGIAHDSGDEVNTS
jgi:hypothetical protein